MKILAITDLHAKISILPLLAEHLLKADLVLLCGDITHFGHEHEMSTIVRQFRDHNQQVYAVSGNCDYADGERYLAREGISLTARIKEFGGYQITGLNGSLPCPGRTPQEFAEEEYEAILSQIFTTTGKPLILVSHQPPFGTLNDQVSPGFHVGSRSIRQFIEKVQPLICFTGHIHEGIAIDHIGNTTVVNPGPAGSGNFAIAELEGDVIKSLQLRNLFNEKAI